MGFKLKALSLLIIAASGINASAFAQTTTPTYPTDSTQMTTPMTPQPTMPMHQACPPTMNQTQICPQPCPQPTETPAPTGGAAEVTPSAAPRVLGTQTVGDYRFQLQTEPSKGWYMPVNGRLTWTPPAAGTNEHIEVVLNNTLDQRFLPNTGMRLSVYDANNRLIQSKPMIMLWAPKGYHYGNNFTIPRAASYNVRVEIVKPPTFARHSRQLGNRFFTRSTANFRAVPLRPEGMTQQ